MTYFSRTIAILSMILIISACSEPAKDDQAAASDSQGSTTTEVQNNNEAMAETDASEAMAENGSDSATPAGDAVAATEQPDFNADIKTFDTLITENVHLADIQNLQAQLANLTATEPQDKVFSEIVEKYTLYKDSVVATEFQTEQFKSIKARYLDGLNKSIELVSSAVKYSVTPPTPEEQATLDQLEKSANDSLFSAIQEFLNIKEQQVGAQQEGNQQESNQPEAK